MTVPVCTVIAGPNGAGKTIFALSWLRGAGRCENFVNADLIAAGLAPLVPEKETVAASRLFLREIGKFVNARESFAFETTLSGRGYLRLIRELVADRWEVRLIYLWLPSVAACHARVAERVARGFHNIPAETIQRRYSRSVSNLLNRYASACTSTMCLDNSGPRPQEIFSQRGIHRVIENDDLFVQLQKGIL